MQTFENNLPPNANSPLACVNKVCSNGGATYIFIEIIAKDNLNIENLIQTFKIFFSSTSLHKFEILYAIILGYVSLNNVKKI